MPSQDPFDLLIGAYEQGAITRSTLLTQLLSVTNSENALQLLQMLPPKLRDLLEAEVESCPHDAAGWRSVRILELGTFDSAAPKQAEHELRLLDAFRRGVEAVRSALMNRSSE